MNRQVKELIEALLVVNKNDQEGITDELIDLAYIAGESVGMSKEDMDRIWNEA